MAGEMATAADGTVWQGCVAGMGHAWQGVCGGGMYGGVGGGCLAGETATAAYSTHPTRMHSCLFQNLEMV